MKTAQEHMVESNEITFYTYEEAVELNPEHANISREDYSSCPLVKTGFSSIPEACSIMLRLRIGDLAERIVFAKSLNEAKELAMRIEHLVDDSEVWGHE